MTLEWLPLNAENCSVTKCGRYSVSVCGGLWSTWRMVPGGAWFAPLAQKLPDEATAKQLAEREAA